MNPEDKKRYRDLLADVNALELEVVRCSDEMVVVQERAAETVKLRNEAVTVLEAFRTEHQV